MALFDINPARTMALLDAGSMAGTGRGYTALGTEAHVLEVGDLVVELRALSACRAIEAQWRTLASRAIERNIFFEPDVLLAGDHHLPEAAGHSVMLVWGKAQGRQRTLLAFWPFRNPRRAFGSGFAAGFVSRYTSSGAPLLEARFAVEAACALLAGLRHLAPASAAAMFNGLALDGAAARTLRAAATINDALTRELGVHHRAAICTGDAESRAGQAKLRRENRRQERGLERHGPLRHRILSSPHEVRSAVELFLALEASGWKAERGTAILSQTRDASFYRCLTRALSRHGQVAVHLLETGDRIAAAGLVMTSGGQGWYVKTAHDETLRAHSPGALLSHRIGEWAKDTGIELDSCAVPGHQMMERVWPSRLRVGDIVIELGPSAPAAIGREMARRKARHVLKRIYYRLRGWPL